MDTRTFYVHVEMTRLGVHATVAGDLVKRVAAHRNTVLRTQKVLGVPLVIRIAFPRLDDHDDHRLRAEAGALVRSGESAGDRFNGAVDGEDGVNLFGVDQAKALRSVAVQAGREGRETGKRGSDRVDLNLKRAGLSVNRVKQVVRAMESERAGLVIDTKK